MKFLKSNIYLSALLLLVTFSSCQKVIDLNLEEGDKKVVIDAVLTDESGGCIVKLSETKSFDDDNTFIGLSGAQVTVADEDGNTTTLPESAQGIYSDAVLKGNYGKSYTLTVKVNGTTYTGISTMPNKVPFDSAYAKTSTFFGNDRTFATVMFMDPVDTQNNYRVVQYVNNKRSDGNFILDDDYSDGKQFESTLYFDQDDDSIKTGDVIKLELQCIDRPTYQYWFSFEQSASGGQGSAAPANPVSNIKGGALGYFSAQTTETKEIIAP